MINAKNKTKSPRKIMKTMPEDSPNRYKLIALSCIAVLIFAKKATFVAEVFKFLAFKSLRAETQNSLASMMHEIKPI